MDEFRRCGPWRDTTLGRVRHCQDRRLRATLDADTPGGDSQREPELPERKTPPACERVVMTERRNRIARRLIVSVFSEGDDDERDQDGQ